MAIVKVKHDGLTFEAEVRVIPGHPGTGPTYSCGGTPPEPAELIIFKLHVCGDENLYEIDEDDIGDDLNNAILEQALDDSQEASDCAKEEAAERRADARREGD